MKLYIINGFRFIFLKFIKSFFSNFKKYKNTYVFIERGYEAEDNAFCLFNYYLSKNIECKYIIKRGSKDASKIKKEHIIFYGSLKHYIVICSCKCIVSTHICSFIPGNYSESTKLKHFSFKAKIVWVRHGISMSYHPENIYPNLKIDLYVCSTKKEYEYVISNYKYPKSIVQLTGLARYDNLPLENHIKKVCKTILFMPTWRMWLNEENFSDSKYFRSIVEVLTNTTLLEYLRSTHSKLLFYPHFEMQKYINFFKSVESDLVQIISFKNNNSVQKLLIDSDILITDYSSVHFDFAFMKKPVFYYQFDQEEFYSKHYKKGYFDFNRDGFGLVCNNSKLIVEEIIKESDDFDAYFKKIEAFFTLRDHNNCARIFSAIEKLYDNNK